MGHVVDQEGQRPLEAKPMRLDYATPKLHGTPFLDFVIWVVIIALVHFATMLFAPMVIQDVLVWPGWPLWLAHFHAVNPNTFYSGTPPFDVLIANSLSWGVVLASGICGVRSRFRRRRRTV